MTTTQTRRAWNLGLLKLPLQSAVVGVFVALIAGQLKGLPESLLIGAESGLAHFVIDRAFRWLFH